MLQPNAMLLHSLIRSNSHSKVVETIKSDGIKKGCECKLEESMGSGSHCRVCRVSHQEDIARLFVHCQLALKSQLWSRRTQTLTLAYSHQQNQIPGDMCLTTDNPGSILQLWQAVCTAMSCLSHP